jgi:hypothetical protein
MPQIGEPICSIPAPEIERAPPVEPRISVRASLFFDGTLNNRTNVAHGAANGGGGGSYGNDYSNVSKLENFWSADKAADHSFSFYVEGIGTQNLMGDVPQGMIEGRGITGVMAKVESGIQQLIRRIDALGSDKRIDYIHLDAFGFSRGAAAARYFVFAALKRKGKTLLDRLVARGYSVNSVEVKFIGLFDTVASHGFIHTDDTRDLELDAISSAERVVQLAAAEEHRKNFALTNIASAKNGREVFLPGAHSDVGGGYTHDMAEEDLQVFDIDTSWLNKAESGALARERAWLVYSGWYTADEIAEPNYWNEIKVTRKGISNRYSRIPLHLMGRFAAESGVIFASRMRVVHPVPKALSTVEAAIDSYVASGAASSPGDWWRDNSELMKALRHGYLHFSASYGGANQPKWTNDDPIYGARQRVIFDG